jgi:hypothetical protein
MDGICLLRSGELRLTKDVAMTLVTLIILSLLSLLPCIHKLADPHKNNIMLSPFVPYTPF